MASVSQYAIPPIEAPIPDSDIDDFITLGRNAVEPASILASHFSQTNIDMVKFDIDQFITIGAKTKSMDLNSTPDNEKTRRKSLFDVALKLVSKRDLVVADDGDLVKNVAVDVFGSQDIDMVLDNISQLPTDDLEPITMEVENKKMDRDVAPNEQIMNYRESKEEDPNSIDIQNLMYIGDAKQDQNPTFSEEDIKYLSNDFEQYVQIGVTDPEPQQSSRNSKVAASMEAIVPIVTTTIRKVFKSLEALSSFDKGDKKERKRVKSYDELSSMVKRDARFSEENEMKRAAVDFDTLGLTWDSKSLANQNNVLNPTINNNKNLNTLSPFQNFSSLPKQQSTSPNLIYSTSPFIAPPNSNSHSRQTSNNNSRQTSTASSTNSGDAFSSLVSFGNKPQNLTLEEQRRGKLSSFTPTPAPTPASYSNFNSPMISKSTSNSGITASTLNFNSTFNSNKPVINEFKPTTPPIPALKPNDVKLTPQTNVNPFPTQPQQKPQDHHWDFDLLSSASNKPPVATTSNPISSSEPQNHAADIFDVGFLSSNNVKKESPIVSSPSPTMKPSATSTPPVKAKVPRKLMEESDESEDDTPYIPSIVKNQGIQWFDDDDEDNKPSVPVSETRGKSFEYSKKNSTENPHDAGNFTYYDNYDHRDRSSSATSASSNAKFPALNDIKSTIDSIQDSQYYQSATQTASIIGASVLSNAKSVFNFSKRKIGEVVEKAKQIDNQQRGGNQEWGIDPNYQRNNQYRENRERQSSSRSWRNEEGWEEYDESKFQDNIPHNREASSKPVQKSVPSPSLPARKPLQQQSAMPKTSPVQKPQFFETASIPPTPPPRPKQVILPPPIPDTILSQYETLKSLGNEAYKLGQYPDSETHYTTAINLNPISIGDALHVIQISLYQNRATARQKIGNYTGVIEDCTFVLSRCNQGEFGEDGWEEVNVKALIRRAGAYEGMEKWKDAEKDYEEVKGMGKGAMVQDGLRRCKLALSSDNSNAQPAKSNVNNDLFFVETTSAVPVRQQTPVRSPKPVSDSVKVAVDEAVQRLRTQNAQAEEEDSKKLAIKDELDAKIAAWKAGKEANLRALLSSLDTILWKELGVQKIALSELITPQQVKIKYMKAVSKVHPDKLPQNTTIEQKLIANTVFSALNHAWDAFKAQNGL